MLEQDYYRPETFEEAAELLDNFGKDARVLAGGTDLIINLKEDMIECKHLIDIKSLPEVREISYASNGELTIGGAVTLNEILDCEYIKLNYPIIHDAAKTVANSLVRNRATMVGNICNASPAGDMLSPALVLEGEIETLSKTGGRRRIPLKDFFKGVKKNALNENEMAVKVIFKPMEGKGCYLRKSRIKGHDLAQVGAAGFLRKNGQLTLALGAVAPTPVLFDNLGSFSSKDLKDEEVVNEIINKVVSNVHPISDQRASKEYRIAMVEYLTRSILENLAKEV